MLLGDNVCFFVMYHYEMNAIFATPPHGLETTSILTA